MQSMRKIYLKNNCVVLLISEFLQSFLSQDVETFSQAIVHNSYLATENRR